MFDLLERANQKHGLTCQGMQVVAERVAHKMLVGLDLWVTLDVFGGIATSAGDDCGDDSVFERTFDHISLFNRIASHYYAQSTSLEFCRNALRRAM